MIKNTGIGYSPVSEKIYLGKQENSETSSVGKWIGTKKDITKQFINVLFQYIEPGTARDFTKHASEKPTEFMCNIPNTKEHLMGFIDFLQGKLQILKEEGDGSYNN